MANVISLLEHGGVGYLDATKRSGWIHIMFENFNSIGIGTQDWKMDCLNHIIRELKIDVLPGCETNTDWRFINPCDQMLDQLTLGTT